MGEQSVSLISCLLFSKLDLILLLQQEGGTHADESETSMMLYIAPETVDMSKAVKDYDRRPGRKGLTRNPQGLGTYSPTGIWGDATLATRKKGRVIVEATVKA
ncbi:MAG: creatininase family protein, partial [Candidatus Aminicenantales bacterium]